MKQPNQIQGYKVEKSTIISLEKGKIPPQAIDFIRAKVPDWMLSGTLSCDLHRC